MLKLLSFRLAGELFGVEITKVKEINRNVEYTAVPRADKNIVGLFNMRGQIVTLFNLATMMGFSAEETKNTATCIILKAEAGSPNQRGFVIDSSGDVTDVNEDMCEAPPPNLDAQEAKYLKAIVRLEEELLRIVETDELFKNQVFI